MKLLKGKRWKPTLGRVTFMIVRVVGCLCWGQTSTCGLQCALLCSVIWSESKSIWLAVESLEEGTRNPCTWWTGLYPLGSTVGWIEAYVIRCPCGVAVDSLFAFRWGITKLCLVLSVSTGLCSIQSDNDFDAMVFHRPVLNTDQGV